MITAKCSGGGNFPATKTYIFLCLNKYRALRTHVGSGSTVPHFLKPNLSQSPLVAT